MAKKKLLYVQHAGALGGSCVSLMYMLRGLDRERFEPVVALARPSAEVADYYQSAGFATIDWPELPMFDHNTGAPRPLRSPSTWRMLADLARRGSSGMRATMRLVETTKADIVHLNSAPLAVAALALHRQHVPLVWHVREHPFRTRGPRFQALRKLMRSVPSTIFISEVDRDAWVGAGYGTVVPNFVDIARFATPTTSGVTRAELGIGDDDDVVMYVGGLLTIKGIFPLLRALAEVHKERPRLRCIMPGALIPPSGRWQSNVARAILPLIGSGTQLQRVEKSIAELGLGDVVIRLPFRNDVQRLLELSDVLAFPATTPHFARPAIEAAAAARPTIVSDLPGMRELVIDGETGLHVPPGDAKALAGALRALFADSDLRRRMGRAAQTFARRQFDAAVQMRTIMGLYERELAGPKAADGPGVFSHDSSRQRA